MRYIYGIRNHVYYNLKPEGDVTWYADKHLRKKALRALRQRARHEGLSTSAAVKGIVGVKKHVASEVGRDWLERYEHEIVREVTA